MTPVNKGDVTPKGLLPTVVRTTALDSFEETFIN